MTDAIKQKLTDKNQKLIDMVIARAKRDFADDIALIGLTGSFRTGDYHEKSDLDLIIVNNTPRGWQISACFILDDVGYDIYCTPWETRLAQQAALENPGVSSLTDLQILYVAKPEYLEKFNALRQQALDRMAKPMGIENLNRAKKHIDLAKQEYADMMLASDLGAIRYASAGVLYHLVNGLVHINNTCIKRGIKRYFEELSAYAHLPADFGRLYMSVVEATIVDEIKSATHHLLSGVVTLHRTLHDQHAPKPTPTYENIKGTYEEAWCNLYNKILNAVATGDKSYTFLAAMSAQAYFDEMADEHCGTPKMDLMAHYDPNDLHKFQRAFLQAMDDYLKEYEKIGRAVQRYDNFDALYADYMNTSN